MNKVIIFLSGITLVLLVSCVSNEIQIIARDGKFEGITKMDNDQEVKGILTDIGDDEEKIITK